MAEHIYEVGLTKTTSAAAGPIATIVPATVATGVRIPTIREIGVFSQSGVAAIVGIGVPAAAGTGAITGGTVSNQFDGNGHTQVATSFATTQPTAPTTFERRDDLQALQGAGTIFTWIGDEFPLWSGASVPQLVIWQISTAAVTYDLYVKVCE